MHNPKSVLEKVMHKILWDLVTQTNHLISARRPDLMIVINKLIHKSLPNSEFCLSRWPQSKSEKAWFLCFMAYQPL